jgi:uncharacterized membrane protein YsdA (DUF1294 family)
MYVDAVESPGGRPDMQRHRFIERCLGYALFAALGVMLLLWRLGLAPVYAFLIGINVVTLFAYGYDKRQAIAGATRVPEIVLHVAALLGGSPAAILSQGLFRHKTRKTSFRMILAMIVLLQITAAYGYWHHFHQ